MKNLVLNKMEVYVTMGMIFLLLCLLFGFGYFFGRHEQIQINRSLLQEISDVNCGLVDGG
ncbi:hypothetical protein KJ951_01685 [Patescibacteria group bacterium]|nr:hypothetical protein [Patescibacteria group bacterium]MBU1703090.1 hypothetical protein [Patescibacteria group bacterium]MBU1954266.1 hypothetical protein [Patescibacteria group bacterium]